jgi:hypothetical protein
LTKVGVGAGVSVGESVGINASVGGSVVLGDGGKKVGVLVGAMISGEEQAPTTRRIREDIKTKDRLPGIRQDMGNLSIFSETNKCSTIIYREDKN